MALALPAAASAQNPDSEGWEPEPTDPAAATFDVEARAGVALPGGDLMEYTDPGVHVGVGAAFWLNDHVALRADGDFANLNGEITETTQIANTPDMRLVHGGLGLEFDVVGRDELANTWSVETNVGVGLTSLTTDDFDSTDLIDDDISATYPNVNAGVEVGREITEDLLLSVGTQVFYTFTDETELANLSELRPNETLENGVSFPMTVTLRYDLPTMR